MPTDFAKRRKRRKILLVIGIIGFVAFALWASAVTGLHHLILCPSKPFSSQAWKSATPVERGQMVRSLLSDYELVGTGEDRIIDLLGQPDSIRRTDEGERYEYTLVKFYWIIGDWKETLCLEFDQQQKCVKVYLSD